MTWLLFLDESGHDHKQMPYEVRGGIALHASKLWSFTQAVYNLELLTFGCSLGEVKAELKGSKLLDKKRFKFAKQGPTLTPDERRTHARSFLMKGLQKKQPTRTEFSAYGQACIEMAQGIFQILRDHDARLFASAIPRNSLKNLGGHDEYLRKDHVFLLERYYYHLDHERENGLLVVDGSDKNLDRKFVRQLEAYFSKTNIGRLRTQWIVPCPFFVSSDMAYPVQASDLCIYCINWAFRLPSQQMNEPVRDEIQELFLLWIKSIQYQGNGLRDGESFETWGICYVPNPTSSGRQ